MAGLGKGRGSGGAVADSDYKQYMEYQKQMELDYVEYVQGSEERCLKGILSFEDFEYAMATFGYVLVDDGEDDKEIFPDISKVPCAGRGMDEVEVRQDTVSRLAAKGYIAPSAECFCIDDGDDEDEYEEKFFPDFSMVPCAGWGPAGIAVKDPEVKFEELNIDDLRNAMSLAENCLRDSGIDKHKVLEVVLVGGSTRTPKHEVKATAGDMHAGGEVLDNRVADVLMRDCKRKSRGKGLALSRVRSEEPNKFHFRSAAGPVERCLRDSGIIKHYSTIEDGIFDGTANGTEEEFMPIDGFGGIALATMGYNNMEIFNPASSMRGPAWHYNHRMCRAA